MLPPLPEPLRVFECVCVLARVHACECVRVLNWAFDCGLCVLFWMGCACSVAVTYGPLPYPPGYPSPPPRSPLTISNAGERTRTAVSMYLESWRSLRKKTSMRWPVVAFACDALWAARACDGCTPVMFA